jgi:hypothetical protein
MTSKLQPVLSNTKIGSSATASKVKVADVLEKLNTN